MVEIEKGHSLNLDDGVYLVESQDAITLQHNSFVVRIKDCDYVELHLFVSSKAQYRAEIKNLIKLKD